MTISNTMNFRLTSLVVDAGDLESESSFWHSLLGARSPGRKHITSCKLTDSP